MVDIRDIAEVAAVYLLERENSMTTLPTKSLRYTAPMSERAGNRNGKPALCSKVRKLLQHVIPYAHAGFLKIYANAQCFCSRKVANGHDPLWVDGYLNE
jgi:hypothetical protein